MDRRKKEKERLRKRQKIQAKQNSQVPPDPGPSVAVPDSGYIDVQVLDYYSTLLKTQLNIDHGLLPPSILYQLTFGGQKLVIPDNVDVVQIHYIDNHYVVSQRHHQTMTVYDSLNASNRLKSLEPQLRILFNNFSDLNIQYRLAQSQGNSADCGVFAAANAFLLVTGLSPSHVILHQSSLRKHLRSCLLSGYIEQFPSHTRMDLMESYFDDQSKKIKQKQKDQFNITQAASDSEKQKCAKRQQKCRNKQKAVNGESLRSKHTVQQRKHRQKQNEIDIKGAKFKCALQRQRVRQKQRESDLDSAKCKRAIEQQRVRQKHRETDLDSAKCKRAIEQQCVRQKHRQLDLDSAKCKRAIERQRVRQKHRETDLNSAKSKQAIEQQRVRQKHRHSDLDSAKCKRAIEQQCVRQKHRESDLDSAKCKRAIEQQRVRQKHRQSDLDSAKCKRAIEQQRVRQKHRHSDLDSAKCKRAIEQQRVRQKHRHSDLDSAKCKRAIEQQRVRQKHRHSDLDSAKCKRAIEQQRVRQKHTAMDPGNAKLKRLQEKKKSRERGNTDIKKALSTFRKHVLESPEYVCSSCSRCMYKKAVVCLGNVTFTNVDGELLEMCLRKRTSAKGKEWLCNTCLRHLRRNKMPPQSDANNLILPQQPIELQNLSSLEERLLSRRYPFMKLIALPKGRQNAIKGAVVNVPVSVQEVAQILPKTPSEAGFVPLKLKRKVEYKGHYCFQYVRPQKIQEALRWLVANNELYNDVQLNQNWEQECELEDKDTWTELTGNDTSETSEAQCSDADNQPESESSSDTDHDDCNTDLLPPACDVSGNIHMDTCIQPRDPTIDANRVLSIAPGEGKHPVSILSDKNFEELSFPSLFPSGKFGYTFPRTVKLSAKKYFQRRLLEYDGRFDGNVEYLFVAQFVSEWQQILSSMSVALRKSLGKRETGDKFNAAFFRNTDHVRPLLMRDDAYRFLRPIRGSPPYWQKVMYELMAAIKQLKIFTWFLTLSAADLRWNDTLQAISRQHGQNLSDEQLKNLSWEERCSLLRSNPTAAARHFHHRVQSLFTDVILSAANPLGKVTNYFYRIEFQQRGSPHVHCILWVDEAPKPDAASKDICNFVDTYVQASVPEDHDELATLVHDLQTHNHTATCRKKGGLCRFNFPRPPSDMTVLSRPESSENEKNRRIKAVETLTKVKEFLSEENEGKTMTVNQVLKECDVPQQMYYRALECATSAPTVFLRRPPSDICVNNFNKDLLEAWKANMDLQYVTSPYAAIHYVTSYITKDEREVGSVLHAVSKEMKDFSVQEQMKKVAFAFSNARNVSAQEAGYRILGLPLYSSDFTTVWVPSGFPEQRVRILKPKSQLEALDEEDENVFQKNIIDRYAARPSSIAEMCLAEFAMWYETYETKSDQGENKDDHSDHLPPQAKNIDCCLDTKKTITLENKMGKMKKKNSPAVVRFHQCSHTKYPEQYCYNRMLLFMPWKDEEKELLGEYRTFSEHYESRKENIESTFNRLMNNAELVDEALEQYQQHGPPTHAWNDIAPETQHMEADLIEEGYESDAGFALIDPESNANAIFDEQSNPSSAIPMSAIEVIPNLLNDTEYRTLVQSLNYEQRCVFQHLLNWAHRQVQCDCRETDPEFIFITGGAGTGKSHLIKAVFNMVNMVLRTAGEDPSKPRVMLTAPTGTAAFNIGAVTVHTAFLLHTKLTDTYVKLADSTCNKLRVQLSHLKMVIIDEISMVSNDMFMYVDKRLQQVKDNTEPFGGVTIVAVGDMYQLRPIGAYVFEFSKNVLESFAGCTWQRLFKVFQLNTIMRQKDDSDFAALLNRVRLGLHNQQDIEKLQSRNVTVSDPQYKKDALHIFAQNAEADIHNSTMLQTMGQPVFHLTRKERRPACLQNYVVSNNPTHTGGLYKTLEVCKNARVMIIRNIDVQDGLVNGALGTIVDFLPKNTQSVHIVLIKFDKPGIGKTARAASQNSLSGYSADVVPVSRVDVSFSTSFKKQGLEITWTQFPIKLAFACTIHKVQGLTVEELVVSFEKTFRPGQAYVALSRCKTLQGLQLIEFDACKIKNSSTVKKEMERMQQTMQLPSPYSILCEPITCRSFLISYLNARSLRLHFQDVSKDPVTSQSDLMLFTETHISYDKYQLQGFDAITRNENRKENHHGLACYYSTLFQCQPIKLPCVKSMEVLGVHLENVTVILIYRSPSGSSCDFVKDLEVILGSLTNVQQTIVMGDFNIHSSTYEPLKQLMDKFTYKLLTDMPTHRHGSTLDHVYLPWKLLQSYYSVTCSPTYYSDHYMISLRLQM